MKISTSTDWLEAYAFEVLVAFGFYLNFVYSLQINTTKSPLEHLPEISSQRVFFKYNFVDRKAKDMANSLSGREFFAFHTKPLQIYTYRELREIPYFSI